MTVQLPGLPDPVTTNPKLVAEPGARVALYPRLVAVYRCPLRTTVASQNVLRVALAGSVKLTCQPAAGAVPGLATV